MTHGARSTMSWLRHFGPGALFFAAVLSGCSTISVPALAPEDVPRLREMGNFPHQLYRVEPGDKLLIRYTYHPEMNQELIVQPDGKITAHLAGELVVSGLTTRTLEDELARRTSDRLRDPEVVVSITSFTERFIYVGGEVGKPGVVLYRKGITPLQAVVAAGGFRDTARADSVILVRAGKTENSFLSRKLNLAAAINDGAFEPLYLAPHDILFIPKTPIAEADLWVRQHIIDLLPIPFRGGITP